MNKCYVFSKVAALALILPVAGEAKDWRLVPFAGVQYKNLQFDQQLSGFQGLPAGDSGKLDVDLPTAELGVRFVYRDFLVALKYNHSFEQKTDSDVPFTNSQTAVTRTDLTFTLGYKLWRGLGVFLGYLDGETELTPDPDPLFNNGSGNAAWQQQELGGPTYRQTYDEAGWFLGVGYGWPIGQAGLLSLSGAYASMDGGYKDNFVVGEDFKYEGDSTGYSLALNWSGGISTHLGYYVDLRRQAYGFEGDNKAGNQDFANTSVETEEVMTSITGGLEYRF